MNWKKRIKLKECSHHHAFGGILFQSFKAFSKRVEGYSRVSFLLKLFFGQAKKSLRKIKSVLFFLDKKKNEKKSRLDKNSTLRLAGLIFVSRQKEA